MDYGDAIIHVFEEETRRYYELEKLWLDAPRIPVVYEDTNTLDREDKRAISGRKGIKRYLKLLDPMARVSIVEIKEQKGKSRADSLSEEGKKILKQAQSYCLLADTGKEFTSRGFAHFLEERDSMRLSYRRYLTEFPMK